MFNYNPNLVRFNEIQKVTSLSVMTSWAGIFYLIIFCWWIRVRKCALSIICRLMATAIEPLPWVLVPIMRQFLPLLWGHMSYIAKERIIAFVCKGRSLRSVSKWRLLRSYIMTQNTVKNIDRNFWVILYSIGRSFHKYFQFRISYYWI